MADPKPDYRNDYVMARLAVSAYMTPEEIRKQELVCSNDPRQDPLPPGWQVLPGSYVNNNVYGGNQADRPADGMRAVVPPSKDGFAAIAFVDPTTRQIVIGFRGSEWEQGVPAGVAGIATGVAAQNNPVLQLTGKADAVAAAASAKGGAVDWTGPDKAFANPFRDWDPQFTDALKYTQAILDLTKPGGPYAGYSVQVTGHSLGGGLAQLAGQMYGLNGRTFDAPPLGNVGVAGEFVDWARGHGLPAKGKGVDPDFMNYFVNESPLRLAGIHYPGRSMNISGQPEHPPLVPTILNDNIATRHDRMRILDLFDDAARTGTLRRTGELPDPHGPRLATAQDPRDPSHPDNAAYARIAGGVEALGKWSGPEAERIGAALYAAYKANPMMQGVDGVVSAHPGAAQERVFVFHQASNGQREGAFVDSAQALMQSPEKSFAAVPASVVADVGQVEARTREAAQRQA